MKVTAEDVITALNWRAKTTAFTTDAQKYTDQAAFILALEKLRAVVQEIYSPDDHGEGCEAWVTDKWDRTRFGPDYDDSKCDCGLARITEALAECDRSMEGKV